MNANQANKYDDRISRIMLKIKSFSGRKRQFGHNGEQFWEPPLTENDVAAFETEKGIHLPKDYRRFITTVASSGNQPFGKLFPPRYKESTVGKPFPYTLNNVLFFPYMTEEEMDNFYDDNTPFTADDGLIPLCHEGDGMYSVLVVNSADKDTFGTVWFYDLANDCGIIPMYDPKTKEPFHFLDWLEYWADRTAALAYDDYFSFSETTRVPEPPDNPEILGRKHGFFK